MAKREQRNHEDERRSTRRRRPVDPADWAGCDGIILKRAICAAAAVGGALRFGYSRDGGAYAIGVYGDGEPYTDFVKPAENIEDYLRTLVDIFEDADTRTPAGQQGTK